jgi:hypothetical protein
MKRSLELAERMAADKSPTIIDEIVEFLLPYVEEPADRKEANEALWDATKEQFDSLLAAIRGEAGNPT